MTYDKDKTAVLIMDYQREIVANYAGNDPEITTRAAAVLSAARAAGILVIHVIVAFRPGHPEIAPRGYFKAIKGAGRLVLGSPETEIHPDVAPEGNDLIVTKKRVGAFASSDLDMLLHAHGIEHLILLGIATSGVVLTTVRVAADMDFEMTVVADCCADMDEEVHRVLTGKVFARGAEITTAADTVAALETLA